MDEQIKINSDPPSPPNVVPMPTPQRAHVRRVFIRALEQRPFLAVRSLGAFFSPVMSGKPAVRIEVCTDDDIKRLHDDKSVEVFEDFQFEPMLRWWERESSGLGPMLPAWQSKA